MLSIIPFNVPVEPTSLSLKWSSIRSAGTCLGKYLLFFIKALPKTPSSSTQSILQAHKHTIKNHNFLGGIQILTQPQQQSNSFPLCITQMGRISCGRSFPSTISILYIIPHIPQQIE